MGPKWFAPRESLPQNQFKGQGARPGIFRACASVTNPSEAKINPPFVVSFSCCHKSKFNRLNASCLQVFLNLLPSESQNAADFVKRQLAFVRQPVNCCFGNGKKVRDFVGSKKGSISIVRIGADGHLIIKERYRG